MIIAIAETDREILDAHPVLQQLRPKLAIETIVADVRRKEREGFRLACLRDDGQVVRAVAGFRTLDLFATGLTLYVDDLVTDATHRSSGYGAALLDWLLAEAERRGCAYLDLDSGLKRLDAHRFYRRHGLEEIGLHFSIPVGGGARWTSE